MKTNSLALLVNAAGQLIQQHAFDHLSDQNLSRMYACVRCIGESNNETAVAEAESDLLALFGQANLYVETTTPQSIYEWQKAMSYFGLMTNTAISVEEE